MSRKVGMALEAFKRKMLRINMWANTGKYTMEHPT
jgi:hypothetical protein